MSNISGLFCILYILYLAFQNPFWPVLEWEYLVLRQLSHQYRRGVRVVYKCLQCSSELYACDLLHIHAGSTVCVIPNSLLRYLQVHAYPASKDSSQTWNAPELKHFPRCFLSSLASPSCFLIGPILITSPVFNEHLSTHMKFMWPFILNIQVMFIWSFLTVKKMIVLLLWSILALQQQSKGSGWNLPPLLSPLPYS